jgi:hypothetical protein
MWIHSRRPIPCSERGQQWWTDDHDACTAVAHKAERSFRIRIWRNGQSEEGARGLSPCVSQYTAIRLFLSERRLFCLHLEREREEGEEKRTTHAVAPSPGPEWRSVFPRRDADARRPSTPHPSPVNHRRRKRKSRWRGRGGDPFHGWLGAPPGASVVICQVMRLSPDDMKCAWLLWWMGTSPGPCCHSRKWSRDGTWNLVWDFGLVMITPCVFCRVRFRGELTILRYGGLIASIFSYNLDPA